MRHVLLAAAAAFLVALPPAALAGDDDAKKEGAKPAPKAPAAAKKEPAPAPAKDGKPAADAAKPAAPVAQRPTPRSRREALAILERIVVSLKFEGTPVREAVTWLSTVTGVNIVLGPALLKEGDADLLKVDLKLTKVSARQALELLVDSHGLGIGFQSGVLTVTTKKEARGKPVLRMYPIGDITFPLRDFPGPELELRPSGAEREIVEETETKPAFSDPDDILRLVKDNTGTGTWEDEGVSGSALREWIVVKQYEEVHEQIAALLAMLRASR